MDKMYFPLGQPGEKVQRSEAKERRGIRGEETVYIGQSKKNIISSKIYGGRRTRETSTYMRLTY